MSRPLQLEYAGVFFMSPHGVIVAKRSLEDDNDKKRLYQCWKGYVTLFKREWHYQESQIKDLAQYAMILTLYSKMMKRHPERWSTTTRNWKHIAAVELNPKHHKERIAA